MDSTFRHTADRYYTPICTVHVHRFIRTGIQKSKSNQKHLCGPFGGCKGEVAPEWLDQSQQSLASRCQPITVEKDHEQVNHSNSKNPQNPSIKGSSAVLFIKTHLFSSISADLNQLSIINLMKPDQRTFTGHILLQNQNTSILCLHWQWNENTLFPMIFLRNSHY